MNNNLTTREKESLKCPLCNSDTPCEYKEWLSSYFWLCGDCPYIGMEYYTSKDIVNLQDLLNFR